MRTSCVIFLHILRKEGCEMARHMTLEDRKILQARYAAGQAVAGIAREMGFNESTIYKELKRGDTGEMDANGRAGYSAAIGQRNLYSRKLAFRYRVEHNPAE